MGRGCEPSLTDLDKVSIFTEEGVAGPSHEDEGDEEVGDTPLGMSRRDVPERQDVQTLETGIGLSGRYWNTDDAAEEDVGDEEFDAEDF